MDKKIDIYSTPSCHFCGMAKEYFKEHGVEFTDHNVATDMERRKEMLEKSQQMGVPVITIKDSESGTEDLIVGFDESKIASLLNIS